MHLKESTALAASCSAYVLQSLVIICLPQTISSCPGFAGFRTGPCKRYRHENDNDDSNNDNNRTVVIVVIVDIVNIIVIEADSGTVMGREILYNTTSWKRFQRLHM